MTKSARKSLGPVPALDAVAKGPPTAEEVLVTILKEYPEPKFIHEPTEQDLDRKNRIELEFLRSELRRKNDQIRRLSEEIQLQIRLMHAMLDGKKESVDYIKRIISKLRGSLEYRGRDDYQG